MDFRGLHGRWIAVRVRLRQESVAARILSEHAYETALPQLPRCGKCKRQCNGGPLFPGYLFCRFDSSNPWHILGSAGVKGIVCYGSTIVPVNSDDVASAMAVSSSSRCRYVVDLASPGSLVQIVAGPLAGIRGQYLRSGKHGRILISAEILRRSIMVELNEDDAVAALS